jgi:hypothetical protein
MGCLHQQPVAMLSQLQIFYCLRQVIKLLKHDTVLKPFYIVLSDDMHFHALYDNISVGTSDSIGGAIGAIPNRHLYGVSNNIVDWECLSPAMPNTD